MTKPIYRQLLILLTVILTLSSCKKYEDDDKRFQRTSCGRIAKKWQLYKITDRDGNDYAKDTVSYCLFNAKTGAIIGSEKYTYYGMVLEFGKVESWICTEVGLVGSVNCSNKKFYSGYYELKFKRTMIKLDLIPLENNPARYFIDDYMIYKMTKDEFIFGRGKARAYFKAAD